MNLRRSAFFLLLLGPVYAACQLVDPQSDLASGDAGADVTAPSGDGSTMDGTSDAADGDAADGGPADGAADGGPADAALLCATVDATFCDDFNRAVPTPADGAVWTSPPQCATDDASLALDGGVLVIDHPANPGTDYYSLCNLMSKEVPGVSSFQLDFDFEFTLPGSTAPELLQGVVIASVSLTLDKTNALGISDEQFQLLLNGDGEGMLIALPHYPDPDASPMKGNSFPSYGLATLYLPVATWIPMTQSCHISLSVDTITPSGSGTAACNGNPPVPLTPGDAGPPPGISAPATLSLGYAQSGSNSAALPEWSLRYDNLVFRSTP